MTYKAIVDDTLERTTFDSSAVSSTARTRIKRFVNEIYRRVLRESGLSRFLSGATTLNTVAGTADYTIAASQIKSIYNPTTGTFLSEHTLPELREIDPMSSATSTEPYAYAVSKVGASTVTITLHPIPSAIITLNLDVETAVTALNADGDVPVIMEDFHYILGAGARMLEAEKMQRPDAYQLAKTEYEVGIRKLRYFIAKSGRRGNLPGGYRPGYSRLGPWFEAGS